MNVHFVKVKTDNRQTILNECQHAPNLDLIYWFPFLSFQFGLFSSQKIAQYYVEDIMVGVKRERERERKSVAAATKFQIFN